MSKPTAPKTASKNDHEIEVVSDRLAAIVGTDSHGPSEMFATYAEQRDELFSTPFARNTDLAASGAPFTILRAVRRMKKIAEGLERAGQTVPTLLYQIRLQMGFVQVVDKNLGEVKEHDRGDILLLEMDELEGGARTTDFERCVEILNHGPIENICLQEYPAKNKTKSNSYGLIGARAWRTVQDVARERAGK